MPERVHRQMTAIKDDYEGYILHIKGIVNPDIRKDTMTIIKWTMVKRIIIRISEIAIIGLTTLGIIPSFLG